MITGEGRTGLLLAEVHRRRTSTPMPTRNPHVPITRRTRRGWRPPGVMTEEAAEASRRRPMAGPSGDGEGRVQSTRSGTWIRGTP